MNLNSQKLESSIWKAVCEQAHIRWKHQTTREEAAHVVPNAIVSPFALKPLWYLQDKQSIHCPPISCPISAAPQTFVTVWGATSG